MPSSSPPKVFRTPAAFSELAGDKQFATTLARGLVLLGCFTERAPYLSNRELSDLTGLPKATISRLTYTLLQMGYLRVNQRLQKYQLGTAVLTVGYPLVTSMTWRQLARPLMDDLARESRGTVSLWLRDRLSMTAVEVSRHRGSFLAQRLDIGFSMPIVASSSGRAYMAACGPRDRGHLVNEVRVKQPALWAEYRGVTEAALQEYPVKSYCMSRGDLRKDLSVVAVPLARTWHHEIIVATCAVQSHLLRGNALEDDIAPKLLALARKLEAAFDDPMQFY
ncbi:IclR family transcriptional regulator [Pseudorhodoferax sp.]|uniref:IclR family transcriptional regulator n=1 Tax=Pseudorhodoferax sp. TaxID=1993553 RepID=UPI002DD6563F|nr:helix-turn-helix domain-containing protein [Pseudorhodoferax sp.]